MKRCSEIKYGAIQKSQLRNSDQNMNQRIPLHGVNFIQ